MYMAPLNFDRFFKRVFSDMNIAKAFIEDFLDISIEEIERLPEKHRFTDDATFVEFDFRCKINGGYIIVDMQQWYKRDIGQRFYLYHALNTGLQLENLPPKQILKSSLSPVKIKDYHALEPVITLVWMADDSLGFKENYVSYCMTPEIVTEFVRDKNLWHSPNIVEILKARSNIIEILDNKEKGLGFLPKNRLIFVLQGNIVRNKSHARYERWFTFAEKSRNDDNKEEDFEEYGSDEVFKEIMRRLNRCALKPGDLEYIEAERELWIEVNRLEQGIYEEGVEVGYEKGMEKGLEKGLEKGMAKGLEKGIEKGKCDMVHNLKLAGVDIEIISKASGLPVEVIEKL